jgi:phospholipase/carboxylesterase
MKGEHKIYTGGNEPDESELGMIMLHGRGSDINDMKSVVPSLRLKNVHLMMPQAPFEIMPGRYAWYSHFWNENLEENLKQLSASFEVVDQCISDMINAGIDEENIVLFGHSQGANLLLEYFVSNPRSIKAVIALRGCLLGEFTIDRRFENDLPSDTPIIIHAGRKDPYIPVKKIDQTVEMLNKLGAPTQKRLYETGHGICRSELMDVKKMFKQNSFVTESS